MTEILDIIKNKMSAEKQLELAMELITECLALEEWTSEKGYEIRQTCMKEYRLRKTEETRDLLIKMEDKHANI